MSQSNSIRNGIVILIAFVVAIWLGITIVTEQTETILKIAAAALLITCIFLGRKIWLLFIFFSALGIPIIRGIGTGEIGQMALIGFCTLMFLMRRLHMHMKFDELDFWRLVMVIVIAQVYFRHPVGLNVFGAGAVGARPYFDAALGIFTGFILSKLVVPPNELRWAMNLTIVGGILSIPGGILRGAGAVSQGGMQQAEGFEGEGAGRAATLRRPALLIAQVISSRLSPLKACFHPIWAPLILLSLAFAALSGYRNVVANVGLIYLAGIAYRGGFLSVFVSLTMGALAIGMLALVNLAYPLPANLQRALSPFPGTWDERYVQGAEHSTEWRVDMWEEALFTDYWIENKILGDGLGFTRRELLMMRDLEAKGGALDNRGSGMTRQQEAMMVTGNYHSGPVQTVRAVGYVGLFFLLIAMTRLAVHAHRLIMRCKGTEWHVLSLFFGIPMVIYPIFFVFIFGEFGVGVKFFVVSSGLLSLIHYNLPIPQMKKRDSTPKIYAKPANTRAATNP
jgi:hypothetical protein